MSYSPEIMLLEIINLYHNITEENTLDINILKNTFYILQKIINHNEKLTIYNNFENSLESFLEKLPDLIEIDNNELIINEDLDLIYEQIFNSLPNITEIDFDIQEYVQNVLIYNSLKLKIPIEETKEIFDINHKIMVLYLNIAEHDYKNKNMLYLILLLKEFIKKLNDQINDIDNNTLHKIKMCCAYYNSLYLKADEENFANSAWKIILFQNNAKQLKKLLYEKVEYLSEITDFKMNEENEELIDDYFYRDIEEENQEETINNFEEIPLFLSYFLIYLNKYLNLNQNILKREVLENLIIKKYFLLSIPELYNIEEYYLEHFSLNNLDPPEIKKEWFTYDTFEALKTQVIECSLSLDYSDEEINNKPYLFSKIVINSLFIKCFLDLSINNNSKKEIISQITSSRFYKDYYYQITTKLIDDIIFNENLDLTKRFSC